MTIRQSKQSRDWRKLQRGQSLVEVALSLTVLILLFSGAIDLGRAFFTKITLDSAVSEGAHWMAAYPGCVAFGAAFGDMSNVVYAPDGCVGTNSIFQRIRNESSLLLPANITSISLELPAGVRPDQITPGMTLSIAMNYKMQVITPVMKWMFGNEWILSSQAQEVLRGTTKPPSKGHPGTYALATNMVTNLAQYAPGDPAGTISACNNGYPSISWTEAQSGVDGYDVDAIDVGTGGPLTTVTNPVVEKPAGSGTTAVPPLQIDIKKGGYQMYGVRSYTGSGASKVYSDYAYIVTSCTAVTPSQLNFTCNPATSSTSVAFAWQMPQNFGWGPNIGPDKSVAGFWLQTKDPLTGNYTTVATWAGRTTLNGDLPFTDTPPTFTDPNRTATFRVTANDGTSAIGVPTEDITIACQ